MFCVDILTVRVRRVFPHVKCGNLLIPPIILDQIMPHVFNIFFNDVLIEQFYRLIWILVTSLLPIKSYSFDLFCSESEDNKFYKLLVGWTRILCSDSSFLPSGKDTLEIENISKLQIFFRLLISKN